MSVLFNFCQINFLFRMYWKKEMLFNFSLEYAVRKVQENQVGLELNATNHSLVYADDINLLGDSINTTKKNTETLLRVSRCVGLEINAEKTKYMIMSCHRNWG
jgi:hypothetical protein